MINKLMKYDFKGVNKILLVYYAILFILTIIVKVVESFEQNFLLVILDKIVSGLYISCICGLAITCLMRIWDRYTKKMYKDESYLTHTLPVTKNQLLNGIILAGIASLVLTIIAIVASLLFTFPHDVIKNMFQSLFDMYGKTKGILFITGMALIVFLESIYFMMSGIFGITLGYKSNNYKLLKSIVIGLGSYGVLSALSMGIIWVISKVSDFEVATQGFPDLKTLKILIITSIMIYLVYNLLLYFISKYILNKGVNVD